MVKHVFYCLLATFIIAACSQYPADVERTLKLAGDNRAELEKVLEHYSKRPDDKLKLRAAEFLIGNMPGHWSYEQGGLAEYYSEADSIVNNDAYTWEEKVSLLNELSRSFSHIETIEDYKIITAQYLINNIDDAFDSWQNGLFARHN